MRYGGGTRIVEKKRIRGRHPQGRPQKKGLWGLPRKGMGPAQLVPVRPLIAGLCRPYSPAVEPLSDRCSSTGARRQVLVKTDEGPRRGAHPHSLRVGTSAYSCNPCGSLITLVWRKPWTLGR